MLNVTNPSNKKEMILTNRRGRHFMISPYYYWNRGEGTEAQNIECIGSKYKIFISTKL